MNQDSELANRGRMRDQKREKEQYLLELLQKQKKINMIGALCFDRLLECEYLESNTDGDMFMSFAENSLCKHTENGTAVILDNASIHAEESTEIMEQHGARAVFTPPYRPYLNPIEYVWSTVKSSAGKIGSRTMEGLRDAISISLKHAAFEKIAEIYNHCHYRVSPE